MSEPVGPRAAAGERPEPGLLFVPVPGIEPPPASEIGGKAWNLARLAGAARGSDPPFEVPAFVVIRASAFEGIALAERPWPREAAEAARRRDEVLALELPAEFRSAVLAALAAAGLGDARLAVRSSAAEEDAAARSFAGQFDSVLGVQPGRDGGPLWDAVRAVWASALNPHAVAYREARATGAVRMAVVVQEMVEAASSGVAFSADPVTGRLDVAVVSAVLGLGEGLVSGALDADTYRVAFEGARAAVVGREIARKDGAVRLAAGGLTRTEPVPEALQSRPAITDDEARRVAACARVLAGRFGGPQDVEWALVEAAGAPRRLVILQARPVTTLAASAGGAASEHEGGARRIWDNSNITESYSGVTTPLTFSFARAVYEDVYRQFCGLMGVSDGLLESHRAVFANMLGLARGRVYYNLLNWYRMLALLPGFTFNRSFMERMMGVRERLEDPDAPPSTGSRAHDLLRLARMAVRVLREARRLDAEVPAFHARVERALAPLAKEDLSAWPADEVIKLYRRLERELLHHWRPPLVNDFFAMIFFGVLCRLIEKWLPDSPPTLANDLLCAEGGMISTEPARRVMALAREIRETPALAALFAGESDDLALWRRLGTDAGFAAFRRAVGDYLERFGDRCMEELKLETVTLGEDPTFLIQTLRGYAARGVVDAEAARAREAGIRSDAEATVRARLGGPRRTAFLWVLRHARRRVRDRENLRFERTRVFAVVRRMFLALGHQLAARGRIATTRDVFHLTRDEIFAHFEGTGVTGDLASLVRQRRAEFEAYAREPAPPDRFETYGPPGEWVVGAAGTPGGRATGAPSPGRATPAGVRGAAEPAHRGSELRGTGCCAGVVRARVRIVRDPRGARDLDGRILVAERTDPGWTLLFPAACGLLVQRGSLLSHSAIVAREMGLPCVVGIAGLLDTLVQDELVEMDGTTGLVRRLEAGAADATAPPPAARAPEYRS